MTRLDQPPLSQEEIVDNEGRPRLKFLMFLNSIYTRISNLISAEEIDDHINSRSNPHEVTITQAIAADNVNFETSDLTNLTDGSNADSQHTHKFTQTSIESKSNSFLLMGG